MLQHSAAVHPSVGEEGAAPVGPALLAGALVFALYTLTLAPTTAFWDASEYIATAHTLGIPHAPGNPLFVLLARAWELLLSPTGLGTAVRINLFSAAMSAGASVFWFLVVHRILAYFSTSETVRRIGAGVSVLVSATAFTVWNQSNVNEKVYTVSLLTIALLSWMALRWRDQVKLEAEGGGGRSDRALVLMAFILALSVANHLMAFLAAPALLLMVVMVKRRVLLSWRLYAMSAVFAVVGLSAHLYLPIRAQQRPVINQVEPTCASLGEAMVSIVTLGRSGCANLSAALSREAFAKPNPLTERLAPLWAQLANYFQYFDWQWARSLSGEAGYFGAARLPFTLLFLGLGVYGAWRHWQSDRTSCAYLATLFATLSLGLTFYMNFEYGFGQTNVLGLSYELGEVRERDYFFLVSFSIWGLWAGIGITALWMRAAEMRSGLVSRFRGNDESGRPANPGWIPAWGSPLLRASPVLLLAFLPLVLNWPYASRAGDYAARDWAYNVLQSVEPYGVLITNGDNDTFPLWYLQEVEEIRQDVTVMVMPYLNAPWYVKQIRDLTQPCIAPASAEEDATRSICQRSFEPDDSAGIYASDTAPRLSTMPLSDVEIDDTTNAGYVRLAQDAVFEARGITTTFAAGTVLAPADQFILRMVKDAWGDRPIYFASTTGQHHTLGLDRFVARQGLAYKLITPEEGRAPGILPMPQDDQLSAIYGGYTDVPRTRELFGRVFIYRDILERTFWPDSATTTIPYHYGYGLLALASAEQMLGDEAAARRSLRAAEDWLRLAGG